MEFEVAEKLARQLMNAHGLTDWHFRWSRAKRVLGSCTEATRTIRLSAYYVHMNDEVHVRDTILHEIAHALAGVKQGHGPAWKAACRRIGADPTRVDHTAKVPEAPYEVYCPSCQKSLGQRHRRLRREMLNRMSCRSCGRKTLGKLIFRINPRLIQPA